MSSSYIVESQDDSKKDEEPLIIMMSEEGVMTCDQETLQKIISNQSNANVSVVRFGQTSEDVENGSMTLTLDPPPYVPPGTSAPVHTNNVDVEAPLFLDPQDLETLESVIQTEEAKHILGENVVAMLDMLSIEDKQNELRRVIAMDHCYTSQTSPSDPKPSDPLPIADSPVLEETNFSQLAETLVQTPVLSQSANASGISPSAAKPKIASTRINKPPSGRRSTTPASAYQSTSKSTPTVGLRSSTGSAHTEKESPGAESGKDEFDDDLSSSTESSESEPSDDDYDFGRRGPRRGGIRARGGRKGLTTRGGSAVAVRRRGPNKHMDHEQVRRLDMEMAAAVDAMKSPEKDEKLVDKPHSAVKARKQIKTMGAKKKDEPMVTEPAMPEKPLQTTNQVKAHLINANMIKGDMILTKPGEGRNNQKMLFVPKQMIMKANELKTLGMKKPIIMSKSKVMSHSPMKDPKVSAVSPKAVAQFSLSQAKIPVMMVPSTSTVPTTTKATTPVAKPKTPEAKKDRRRSESSDGAKSETEAVKGEIKTPEGMKKHAKKEHRKPVLPVDTLGPALFSTPDIIRRVGGAENKPAEPTTPTSITSPNITPTSSSVSMAITSVATPPSPAATPSMPTALPTVNVALTSATTTTSSTAVATSSTTVVLGLNATDVYNVANIPVMSEEKLTNPTIESQLQMHIDGPSEPANPMESTAILDNKPPSAEELQSSLDPGGIEGEEHLLATLEMEASKHEADLLAEALLLQEELGVEDLGDNSLVDQTPEMEESLLPTSTFAQVAPLVPKFETQSQLMDSMTNLDPKRRIARNEKEPIQIIRGGRVITLPPIEAPATRSKKLQVKSESPGNVVEVDKSRESLNKSATLEFYSSFMEDEMEDEDGDEAQGVSDSEDDPNRLWCICKKPHNNRFMICCDKCEDWFHGHCVHISKAMGKQMEEQGIEWVCPNCSKKKPDEMKGRQPLDDARMRMASLMNEEIPVSLPEGAIAGNAGVMHCVVCKKEARNSSIYCSDTCILAHAKKSTKEKDSPVPTPGRIQKIDTPETLKPKEQRVPVFDRKTENILTGPNAPTKTNLHKWLKEHPTFEVLQQNSLNNIKIKGKTVPTIQIQDPSKNVKIPSLQPKPVVGPPKMVIARVSNSKQTIIASSKKFAGVQQQQQQSPQPRAKPSFVTSTPKPSGALKQTTLKQFSYQTTPPVTLKVQTPTPKSQVQKKHEMKQKEKQQQTLKIAPGRRSEVEPIRENVRKTLAESLGIRIKETEDLKLTEEEITELAMSIEIELYKFFKDTGHKYRAKYRSLYFNIKDTKNSLFRKIADKSLTPNAVVRLSPEEMASQELAEWREKETKHQLEMIKKNELDLIAQAKSIVVKTHKGEQIIEKDGMVDANTSVQDIVTALNSGDMISSTIEDQEKDAKGKEVKKEEERRKKDKDRGRKRSRERGKEHRDTSGSKNRKHRSKTRKVHSSRDRMSRSKDSKREKDKKREKEHDRSKDKSHDRKKHKRSKSKHHEHRERDKKEDEDNCKEVDKKMKDSLPPMVEKQPIEERLWRHIDEETTTNTIDGNDSDVSDREPSSTVIIKTPDINEDVEREHEPEPEMERAVPRGPQQTVWRGFVNMSDVAKFFISAQEVSGYSRDLMDELPDTLDVVGRIGHDTVWEYISKMKKNSSKEILVIRLTAANDEEKIPYITLYSYLNSRSRLGVMATVCHSIKDFYIMPLPSGSKIPNVLLPFDGPGFEENRGNLLLGIIVRTRRKRSKSIDSKIPVKIAKVVKKEERSYTPPLAQDVKEKPELDSATISKIVPELSSKIDFSATSLDKPIDDEDEPYSPGTSDDDLVESVQSVEKNTELQRKMDELNRKIEEQKMQIQNISSSFLGENNPTLPGFGLDPPSAEMEEAYSPSNARSFTPPPQGLAKFAQPILDKVSDITIPANLQEILANVKRQETAKVDPYIPSKPSATFLTSVTKYPPRTPTKSSPSTLSKLSDSDLIKKAEEELAPSIELPDLTKPPPPLPFTTVTDENMVGEQPKPPGLEDEEPFSASFGSKSSVVNVKRKNSEELDSSPKMPRAKSRWSQGPSE